MSASTASILAADPAPSRYPDATRQAMRFRGVWVRQGPAGRHWVRQFARVWLRCRAPVVVPLSEPVEAGRIVLNGPGYCALSILLRGGHEHRHTGNFAALLRSGMTVLDVGANLGVYTLLAAKGVGPTGEVHAFEPVPHLNTYLRESVRLSCPAHTRVYPEAISDRNGRVTLHLAGREEHSGLHSLAPSPELTRQAEVPTRTLDSFVQQQGLRRVDLVKIDIEGAELLAFRGAEGLLSGAQAPIVQSEVAEEHCAAFGHTARDVKAWMAERGYTAFKSVGQARWVRVEIDATFPRPENLLFFRPEHRPLLPVSWEIPWS